MAARGLQGAGAALLVLGLAGYGVLSTHQGTYGTGAEGFSSPHQLVSNTLELIQQQPALVTVAAATLALALVRCARPGGTGQAAVTVRAVGAGLVVQTLVLGVLVAKHPRSGYLLSVAATLPGLLATLLETADPIVPAWRRTTAVLGVVGVLLFAHGLWSAVTAHVAVASTLRRDDVAMEVWLDRVAAQRGTDRQALRTLWTYGTTSQCYALWYGDWTAGNVFATDIGRLCPRDGGVDIAAARVWSAAGSVDVAQATNWDVEIIPRLGRETYPDALLEGDVEETELASVNPVSYAGFGSAAGKSDPLRPDRVLLLVVRQ